MFKCTFERKIFLTLNIVFFPKESCSSSFPKIINVKFDIIKFDIINVKFEELYLKKDFNFVDLLGNIQYDEGGRIIGGHQNKSVQKLVQKHFLISATDNTMEKKLFHIFSFHRHFIFIYCLILWAAIKPLFSVEINNRSLPSNSKL